MTITGQTTVSYEADDAHRLTSITKGTASVALAYDDASRRASLTYPNGVVASYTHDNANRLTGISYALGSTMLGDVTYTHDAAGTPVTVGGSWARTGLPPALTSASYDAANRIATWGGVSSTYDLNGNLTSDGSNSYSWNARNQLTGISGGSTAGFAYDALARRRSRTVSGTTNFLYDGLSLVQELSGGSPTANLLGGPGIDETLTRTDTGGTSTLLADALGSTSTLTSASGTVQTTYTYEPFGQATIAGASTSNSTTFTGRESDDTGLHFYRARYYDPRRQRFLSEDPLGLVGGRTPYIYVENAPTMFIDPLGLQLANGSPKPWWIKPEEAHQPTKCVPPSGTYDGPIDGAASLAARGRERYSGSRQCDAGHRARRDAEAYNASTSDFRIWRPCDGVVPWSPGQLGPDLGMAEAGFH